MTDPAPLHPFSPEAIARRAMFAGWTMEGGGADPAADPSSDPGQDPAADPAADPNADPNTDPANDPSGDDDARVKRANADAARYRTQLRDLQAQHEQTNGTLDALRRALDPNAKDGEGDPAAQVTELTGAVEKLTSDNATLRAELLVHTIAADNGGNPNALLDSRGFLNTLQGLDPEGENYRTEVAAAIKAAVKANANLSVTGQGPSRGGAADAGTGSSQPHGSVTQEQFDAMSYKQRGELYQNNPDLYRRLAG